MCGIAGLAHGVGGTPVDAARVRAMCDAIRHRGPDDEGLFVEGGVGLGMRRLSIIDLNGSRQPIINEDGNVVLVFNGEIYNYRGLRDGLLTRGHTLRTQGDTETIVHLYEELGAACVEPLRGMFAFALWDKRRRSLLLARDRFGIKPLYVVTGTWGIAFASELKALLAADVDLGPLDWDALDAYFQLGYLPAPLSPLLNVRKLEPGHTLEWSADGTVRERGYWDLPAAAAAVPDELPRRVVEWLDESVAAHLVADVPVAAFLSGGLDSSAVVASMAIADGTPHAFTVRYHGSGAERADETPLAQALADRYHAQLTVVDVHPDVRESFEKIVWSLDEPHADESALPTWLICRAVAQSYKVALSGTGGDELFVGYRRHLGLLAGALSGVVPGALWRAAGALAGYLPEPEGSGLGVDRMKRFLRTTGDSPAERYLGYMSRLPDRARRTLYAPALRQSISGDAARRRFLALHERGGASNGLRAGLYLDYKVYLPDDILALADRVSMAHSLEVRVPFVDHPLVEHVFPLPARAKIGVGRPKRLLRRALRSRLPAAHFGAPKRGFVGPTAAWLRNELRDVLTDELSAARMVRLGFFDPAVVTGLLDDHFERRHNREGILWALLCFSTWHRLYLERGAGARG